MPFAIMVYNLPEEQEEFNEARDAGRYRSALGDVWNKVRSKLKYEELPEGHGEVYEQVRSWLVEACDEWEVEVP